MQYLVCDNTSNGYAAGDMVEIGPDSLAQLQAWGCVVLPVLPGDNPLDYASIRIYGRRLQSQRSCHALERAAIAHSIYRVRPGEYDIHFAARVTADVNTRAIVTSVTDGSPFDIRTVDVEGGQATGRVHGIVPGVRIHVATPMLQVQFAVVADGAPIEWTAVTLAERA